MEVKALLDHLQTLHVDNLVIYDIFDSDWLYLKTNHQISNWLINKLTIIFNIFW